MHYYNEIKIQLINNEVYKKAKEYSKNKNDLSTYYNVGKLLSEAGKHYGEGIIKEYSMMLTQELGRGYGLSSLKNMRKFYLLFSKSQAVPDQLTWSHYVELLKFDNMESINYYIDISVRLNLSYRQLRERIRNKEYERLDDKTKEKLINNEENNIQDFIKNPIIIKSKGNYENINEKALKQLILEDISGFMKELGDGFSFIEQEYKISFKNNYNYIDLLLFNYIYNCFVVVELKVTELKKEHIGQIEVYMNYIDRNIKRLDQDKTIGIIVCKKDNKYVIEYSSDERIYSSEYILI